MRLILILIGKIIRKFQVPVRLTNIRSVLVVDPNFIGDMLLSSPVYRALKDNLPGARVETLVFPFTTDALSANPFIDRIHTLPRGSFIKQLKASILLRKEKFDLVLQLNTSLKTNFLMWLIGDRYRLGYDYKERASFNNIRIPIKTRTARTRYRVDECLGLLEQAFGWKITDREMILQVADEYQKSVSHLLEKAGVHPTDILIGIHANCRDTWKERRWVQSKFSELSNDLINTYNAKIVYTGSKDDLEYVKTIIDGVESPQNVINVVGKTSLMELAALLRRLDVLVTVNTGPMQIAVSQKTPTVVLMGVTPPVVTYPSNVDIFQYVWNGEEQSDAQLKVDPKDSMRMESIEVTDVLEKVKYLLALRRNPR